MVETNVNNAKRAACVLPFRTQEATKWLGISSRQLLGFARAGLIGKKIGNIWIFSQQELVEFAGVPTDGIAPLEKHMVG